MIPELGSNYHVTCEDQSQSGMTARLYSAANERRVRSLEVIGVYERMGLHLAKCETAH